MGLLDRSSVVYFTGRCFGSRLGCYPLDRAVRCDRLGAPCSLRLPCGSPFPVADVWGRSLAISSLPAIREVFGECAEIQRCQWKKRENVVSYLPKDEQKTWRYRLQRAYREHLLQEL